VSGRSRLDPLQRPGHVLIRRIAALVPDSDDVLWQSDAATEFAEVRPGPGVSLFHGPDTLEVRCTHDDPQLFLPAPDVARSPRFDLVVEMFCPKE
jgi:hypothetical protein